MKVGIVGLGLIGGSLGLDLRSRGFEVVGVARRQVTCEVAAHRGVVDRAARDWSILAGAEMVFICTPIAAIASSLEGMIPSLNPEAIVTDVGSVKVAVVEECARLWPNFIGGHPMAGTAEQGIEAAERNLFQNAPYVITPIPSTSSLAINKLVEIARSLGSQVYTCNPQIHDRAVALISHLPVMIGACLIDACIHEEDREVLALAKNLAASGFRDTSRVGGGNVELGLMMAKYNRQHLLSALHQYRHHLDKIIATIEAESWHNLEQILTSTREARPDFLK